MGCKVDKMGKRGVEPHLLSNALEREDAKWAKGMKKTNSGAFGGMFAGRAPGALPFYSLSRLQPEIYPLMHKAPKIDHDGLRTFHAKHVAK